MVLTNEKDELSQANRKFGSKDAKRQTSWSGGEEIRLRRRNKKKEEAKWIGSEG